MVRTYIRFLFANANSDQNGEGCQGVGCCGLYGGVQFQATIPNFLLVDNPRTQVLFLGNKVRAD
jgi:hypothetical protein